MRLFTILLLLALSACHDAQDRDPDTFDVIVVGSGAGGGTVAARLAEAGKRVLLLEAGADVGDKRTYAVPAMHALATEDRDMAWWFFVKHHSEEGLDAQDSKATPQGILYPRGSALGGSTAVNAMVTVLPSPSDWDSLAVRMSEPSLRASAMRHAFTAVREWLPLSFADTTLSATDKQIETMLRATAETYVDAPPLGPVTSDATAEATAVLALASADVNDTLTTQETTGVFRLPLATRDGRRAGTRERILDVVAKGHPLEVRTNAFVTQVLWETSGSQPRAVGVEYVDKAHVYQASLEPTAPTAGRKRARANLDVILSAGVFNTPQLLMLSGVGDAAVLTKLGIQPLVDRPGVGRNLQDRYEAPVVTELASPLTALVGCRLPVQSEDDPCLTDWAAGRGVYTTPGFIASALMRTQASSPLADLQVFTVPSDARGYYPGYAEDAAATHNRFSWLLLKAHTANHDGTVSLRSKDPFQRPDIHFHSFDERDPLHDPDLLSLVAGVRFVRRVVDRLHDTGVTEVRPGPEVATDEQLAAWIRKESWGHHACCTDKMGPVSDPDAVVDAHFSVHGTRGLRVVDASVFPEIPGTFIALPTMMLAEHASLVLLQEWQ